jgi:hypothetical protein
MLARIAMVVLLAGWSISAVAQDQAVSEALRERVHQLGYNTFRSYACMYLINSHASGANKPKQIVQINVVDGSVVFSNDASGAICGRVTFARAPDNTEASRKLRQALADAFLATAEKLDDHADTLAKAFLPDSKTAVPKDASAVDATVQDFHRKVAEVGAASSRPANALPLPVATGPDALLLAASDAEAKLYMEFETWLRSAAPK